MTPMSAKIPIGICRPFTHIFLFHILLNEIYIYIYIIANIQSTTEMNETHRNVLHNYAMQNTYDRM